MLTWKPKGEANEYFIMDGKRWVAGVQLNGEMTQAQQESYMSFLVACLNTFHYIGIGRHYTAASSDDFNALITSRMELLDLLTLALPYVETAADDPGYKAEPVNQLADKMRTAVERKSDVSLSWPIRGVRVEGDSVIITVKGGNDAARQLCGEIITLKQGGAS